MLKKTLVLLPTLLLASACGGPPGLFGTCDPTVSEPCADALVCDTTDNVCRKDAGAACDPAAEQNECETGRVCIADGDSGTCSLMEGDPCDPAASECPEELECAELSDGSFACYPPVLLIGDVTSTADGAAIEGAHVIALNQELSPVTDVAVTDTAGHYELVIPVVRDANGAPTAAKFTLRAGAADFQTFPAGIRQALPIEATDAVETANGWEIDSALTQIGLIPLAVTGLPKIVGTVDAGANSGGVLVIGEIVDATTNVVEEGNGVSGLSDLSGAFTIFNVADGQYTLRGYRADVQLAPEGVTIAGADETGVVLSTSADPTATISGNVIIRSPGESDGFTSVVMIPKSRFDRTYVRGEVPPGLRAPRTGAPSIENAFSIIGVPDGQYVVLAGFENDGLVRDESNTGNTTIVEIEVPDPVDGRTIDLAASFALTGDLAVTSPGVDVPEAVTDPPTFTWENYSNEDHYEIIVLDALGNVVWERLDVPGVSSGATASIVFGDGGVPAPAPALEAGMIYQFRVAAIDNNGFVQSRTEGLRGVFYLAP